ncbi:F0F1 ATP synthase subunit A [Candidatus Uhrbacteria bacterium]|nr:F0F1 ATP synthase subunit A [Candidatus Uhrbacteria bacterium]
MISIAAEPIFHLGSFAVTNSIFTGWIVLVVFVITGLFIRRRAAVTPQGFAHVVDTLVDFLLVEMEKITGNKTKARRFFPLVASLFFFILLSNWIGLLPGVGSIGVWAMHQGERELIPLFRPATSDLNFTLAIAIISVVSMHIFGLLSIGFFNHFSKFFNFRGIVLSVKKGPMALVVALSEFFVGLLETIGEVAKTASLALRLFGNVFAGEVLLTVIYSMVAYLIPLPFLFLEMMVGLIQATVFAMLTVVFLSTMTTAHGGEEEHAAAH